MLPGALLRNAGLTFVSKPVDVTVEQTDTAFTCDYEPGARLRLPVAHGEGRFVASPDTLRMLEAEGRVVLRYVAATERSPFQPNPNGSTNHIAGICNAAGQHRRHHAPSRAGHRPPARPHWRGRVLHLPDLIASECRQLEDSGNEVGQAQS